jgi:hypothetical protein
VATISCPDCGDAHDTSLRGKTYCKARGERRALERAGLRVLSDGKSKDHQLALCRELRIETKMAYTRVRNGSALADFYVPAWAYAILIAEPVLPSQREQALKRALYDDILRNACEAALTLGDRSRVADILVEMFDP